MKMKLFLEVTVLLTVIVVTTDAWQSNDKVLLTDVKVLTLYNGRMTTGRRSAPVPQMVCVGGSAKHSGFVPQVVQCYNRGSDGTDVQWECNADMDNAYRFGAVEVVCEGYDYPDDPYILKGSCGLEYSLEYTKEGYEHQNHGQRQNHHSDSGYQNSYSKKKSNWFGDIVMLVIVGVIIYAIYRTCIAGPEQQNTGDWQDGTRRTPPPPYTPRDNGPPPAGFRNEYMPGGNDDGNCHSTRSNTYNSTGPSTSTGGGFWTGAATGGLLGYLFGSRTNTGYGNNQPYNRGYGGGWGTGWGGGGGWGSGFGSRTTYRGPSYSSGWGGSSGGSSTGTRTASGFGGTRRR